MYGDVRDLLPDDSPTHMGKYVRLTHYDGANIFYYQLTGSSVMGIINLANKNPVGWYSKKQSDVKTSIYGSGFFSAHTCVE